VIVAQQKPLEEIRQMLVPYDRVLILGCGTCMTVCDAGGEREVSYLHSALRVAQAKSGNGTHATANSWNRSPIGSGI
jgi:ferredoxin